MATEIATTAREDARNSFASDLDPADVIADFQSANAGIAGYQSDEYRAAFMAEWSACADEAKPTDDGEGLGLEFTFWSDLWLDRAI